MYIRLVSLGVRAIKRVFERVIAFLAQGVHSKHVIIAHYSTHRWCDSTERALYKELMGRDSWLGNCFEAHK
jgi:hypothetical protein